MSEKNNKSKERIKNIIIVVLTIIIIILLMLKGCTSIFDGGNNPTPTPLDIDETQGEYVKPETPIDRSQNVTLPGWGSFTIPKNTTTIDKGFEFHNPAENTWYEVSLYYNDEFLEKLIVDSAKGSTAEHYGKLANIKGSEYKFKSFDKNNFEIITSEDGIEYLTAINPYDGSDFIVIEVDGQEYTLEAKCEMNLYYMTFELYLQNDSGEDELLYKSGLVAPGKYIQTMELSRALAEGDYKAYISIQPYRSDRTTKTNAGKVVIDLYVK